MITMETRLKEIEARKLELRADLEDTEKEVDLEAVQKELEDLQMEMEDIKTRLALVEETEAIDNGEEEATTVEKEERTMTNIKEVEKRAKELLEQRTVTSKEAVLPEHSSDVINPRFNTVSSLVDAVNVKQLQGGESYKAPYRVGDMMAGATEEGAKYHETAPKFAYAEMVRTKVTDYVEITEEIEKLPSANYVAEVEGEVGKGIKRKLNQQILLGNGGANEFVGIFSDKAEALTGDADIEIVAIGEDTLDDIIFSYGLEDVEGDATLILSKASLREFAKLRTELGTKVYDITVQGNTGTIDGVPFIINNFADAHDEFFMAYGNLANYELAVFSDVDMQRSADFKFDQGIVAYRGSMFSAGNVTKQDGFVRVKKTA